jgi:hypothetical protein
LEAECGFPLCGTVYLSSIAGDEMGGLIVLVEYAK